MYLVLLIWNATQHYANFNVQLLASFVKAFSPIVEALEQSHFIVAPQTEMAHQL